ncbi:DMT family transporter, partial [Oribacterium parvum]|uniref:DMT family transporter n=1 Tax=Oribacterium parvum TaxID=1501329 RepID=UPI0028E869F3
MKKIPGIIGLVTVTIIWGGGFVASDIALKTLAPFQIMFLRFLIGAICMGVLARKELKTITKDEIFCGFLLGAALFTGFALQIVGLQYTAASKNAFLTATNVVMVPFIAFILERKKIELKSIAGAVLALTGAGILSLQSGFSIGLGDSLTLGCAIGFAFQIYLTGKYVHRIRPAILNFMQMLSACILSFIGLLLSGKISLEGVSSSGWLAMLYLGVVSTTLCYFLQTWAQKHVDETKSAIILSMEAVFGTVFSVILLQEEVTSRMILGSI